MAGMVRTAGRTVVRTAEATRTAVGAAGIIRTAAVDRTVRT